MKRIISLAILLVLLIALGSVLFLKCNESIAICKPSKTSTPYCKFVGKTTQVYLNSDGLGLVFIDGNIDTKSASDFGYAISSGSAFAFDIQSSHGRAMFDMALLARQHNFTIEVHAREVEQGYLLADRIWVK